MCLMTFGIWAVLVGIVIGVAALNPGDSIAAATGITAVVLGVVLPITVNYWRPLLFGWAKRRKRLSDKLLADGVLEMSDLEHGARYGILWEVKPGTEKKLKQSKQEAFLLIDGDKLRLLGKQNCFNSDIFKILPSCTGQCSRCWVIWACGGDPFRLQLTIDGNEREFRFTCMEGRSLRGTAKSTEMLEEMVATEARQQKQEESDEKTADPDDPKNEE